MPLVSGVCRVASAPMLSHGGSRLNASKPEANPKTSCPKQINISEKTLSCKTKSLTHTKSSAPSLLRGCCVGLGGGLRKEGPSLCVTCVWSVPLLFPPSNRGIRRSCDLLRLFAPWKTVFTLQIESPLKRLQHPAVSMARST